MFLGFHATDETVHLILQEATKDGCNYCGSAFWRNKGRIGSGVWQQLQQLRVKPVQQISHELMGILLLVTSVGKTIAKIDYILYLLTFLMFLMIPSSS